MEPVIGEPSGTLPPLQMMPPSPPATYMGIAYAMLPGVRILAAATPLPALPLAMLSAHVLECILKAYLSRSGNDQRVTKRDVRHNLNALWSMAHAEGLDIQVTSPQWVDCLSHLHDSPYYLRYSTGVHGITAPAPEPMVTELGVLIDMVQSQIKGYEPFS